MVHAIEAVRAAVFTRLSDDSMLCDLLGGPRVYDHVPERTGYPYVSLGTITTRDWSTQLSHGHEHLVTLHAWSMARGPSQVHTLLARIDELLDGADLTLADHQLVNLTLVFWTAMRDPDTGAYHGLVRLRAVTEPDV